ncbi:hypothetical protein BKA59DRAFT_512069 [Fusarium tricinctum]|uniref:Uncharacterized protein n=1 Tax=Fusarium tricinctum TaxID=61284 RepID=A0A8K0RYX5_9HYPO|nr:hypothetical protein BKA59DRAFT_512069 [Fusarium tricinctum]
MPGWKKPTTNARTFDDLPKQARDYVEYIEKFVGVKIKWIGTGPDREAMIKHAWAISYAARTRDVWKKMAGLPGGKQSKGCQL